MPRVEALTAAASAHAAAPCALCSEGELPNDLACDKEGFYIAGFERAGVFSGTQSTAFPLSAALCCRPCFSDDPASAAVAADVAAVVSTACLQSRWEGEGQACPDDTLVMGYDNARLGSPINRYYPVGPAQCCRPALLLRNGSTRLLRRCGGCGAPTGGSEVSCGGDDVAASQAGGRLLAGWAGVLRQPGSTLGLGDAIPLAPAQCCGVCLDPAESACGLPCETSNFCSGHGSCGVSGRCVCDSGWGGTACADGASSGAAALVDAAPILGVVILVAAACFAAMVARANALSRALVLTRRAAAHAAAARRAELEQPLLPVSSSDDDAEWGAGSSEDEEAESEEDDGSDAPAVDAEQQPEHTQPPAEGDAEGDYSPPIEVDADKPAPVATTVPAEAAQAAAAAPRRNWLRNAPECTVCMDARVQICFLPCGCVTCCLCRLRLTAPCSLRTLTRATHRHACACRPCARRMRRCPICRIVITRRQKLFIAAADEE